VWFVCVDMGFCVHGGRDVDRMGLYLLIIERYAAAYLEDERYTYVMIRRMVDMAEV